MQRSGFYVSQFLILKRVGSSFSDTDCLLISSIAVIVWIALVWTVRLCLGELISPSHVLACSRHIHCRRPGRAFDAYRAASFQVRAWQPLQQRLAVSLWDTSKPEGMGPPAHVGLARWTRAFEWVSMQSQLSSSHEGREHACQQLSKCGPLRNSRQSPPR